MGVLSLPAGAAAPAGGIAAHSYSKVEGAHTAQETFSRWLIQGSNLGAITNQRVHFTFFQAESDLLVDTFNVPVGGTVAAATPTGTRLGLYSVPASWSGSMDCVAASADTPALFTGGSTFSMRTAAFATDAVGGQAMPTEYQLVEGDWYAHAIWLETAAAVPTFYAMQNVPNIVGMMEAPLMAGVRNGQTDLPLGVVLSSLSSSTGALWAKLT